MTDPAPLERMQQMADYRTACNFLKRSGKQGIAFGCIFLFIGVAAFANQIFDYLYIGIGSIELLIGLRNRYQPSALGIILDGLMLILLGIGNLISQALFWRQGIPTSWFNTVFGALMIGIGIQRLSRYSHVKAAFDNPPTEEQIAWFDDVIKEVQEAPTDPGSDAIEFQAGLVWKGQRFGDTVLFVDKMDFETIIVDRRDIDWEDKGKALFSSRRHGRLRIGKRNFAFAEIQPELATLLIEWRAEATDASSVDAIESEEGLD